MALPTAAAAHPAEQNRRAPVRTAPIVPAIPLMFMRKSSTSDKVSNGIMPDERGVNGNSGVVKVGSQGNSSSTAFNGVPVMGAGSYGRPKTALRVDTALQDGPEHSMSGVRVQQYSRPEVGFESSRQDTSQALPDHPILSPFYPPQHQSVPSSAGSQQISLVPLHYSHTIFHPIHPAQGTIVFGGYPDSSNSSPAPPYQLADPQRHPLNVLQYPQDNHTKPHGPFTPELVLPRKLVPYSTPSSFYPSSDVDTPHEHGAASNGPGFRERILSFIPSRGYSPMTPSATAVDGEGLQTRMNGGAGDNVGDVASRHEEQVAPSEKYRKDSPEGAAEETDLSVDGMSDVRNPSDASNYQPSVLAEYITQRLPSLESHYASYFARPEFSDCVIELRDNLGRFENISIPAHRLVLSRSLFLREQLERARDQEKPQLEVEQSLKDLPIISLETTDRYLTVEGFKKALQYLYGVSIDELLKAESASGESTAETLDGMLGICAAAMVLHLNDLAGGGAGITDRLLPRIGWNTMEQLLSFCLEDVILYWWIVEENDWWTVEKENCTRKDPRRARTMPEDSEQTSAIKASEESLTSTWRPRIYEEDMHALLHWLFGFIIRHFPPNFRLDSSVPEMSMQPRLPVEVDGDHLSWVSADPRLGSIRFGDYPLEDEINESDPSTTVLSTILLSLPFRLLQWLFSGSLDLLPAELDALKVLQDVIREREYRRRRATKILLRSVGKEELERREREWRWDALIWEESVTGKEGGNGFELSRRRIKRKKSVRCDGRKRR